MSCFYWLWPLDYENRTVLNHLLFNVMKKRINGYFSKIREKSIWNDCMNTVGIVVRCWTDNLSTRVRSFHVTNFIFQKESDTNLTQHVRSLIKWRCATYDTGSKVCHLRSQRSFWPLSKGWSRILLLKNEAQIRDLPCFGTL